jgi:hypothetical protein
VLLAAAHRFDLYMPRRHASMPQRAKGRLVSFYATVSSLVRSAQQWMRPQFAMRFD